MSRVSGIRVPVEEISGHQDSLLEFIKRVTQQLEQIQPVLEMAREERDSAGTETCFDAPEALKAIQQIRQKLQESSRVAEDYQEIISKLRSALTDMMRSGVQALSSSSSNPGGASTGFTTAEAQEAAGLCDRLDRMAQVNAVIEKGLKSVDDVASRAAEEVKGFIRPDPLVSYQFSRAASVPPPPGGGQVSGPIVAGPLAGGRPPLPGQPREAGGAEEIGKGVKPPPGQRQTVADVIYDTSDVQSDGLPSMQEPSTHVSDTPSQMQVSASSEVIRGLPPAQPGALQPEQQSSPAVSSESIFEPAASVLPPALSAPPEPSAPSGVDGAAMPAASVATPAPPSLPGLTQSQLAVSVVEPAVMDSGDTAEPLRSGSLIPPPLSGRGESREGEQLEAELTILRQQLAAFHTENVTLKVQLASQIDTNSELRLKSAELEARLANQVSSAEALQQRCSELQDALAQQSAREAGLRASIASMAAQGATEEKSVQALREANSMMDARIQQLQASLSEKNAELAATKEALQRALTRESDQVARVSILRSQGPAPPNQYILAQAPGFHLGATQVGSRPSRGLSGSSVGPDVDPEDYLTANTYDIVDKLNFARRALLSVLSAGIGVGLARREDRPDGGETV